MLLHRRAWGPSAALLITACSLNWSSLDPRDETASSSTSTTASGTTTGGGAGGVTSTSSTTAGGGGAGMGGGGGQPPVSCATTFTDNFGQLDQTNWSVKSSQCSLSVASGRLILDCLNAPAGAEVELESIATYDLSACPLTVKVDDVTSSGDAQVGLEVYNETVWARMAVEGDALVARLDVGENDSLAQTNFDDSDQVYWRIRGANDCILWETSKDGQSFTTIQTNCSVGLSVMSIGLYARIRGRTGADGSIAFDRLAVGVP